MLPSTHGEDFNTLYEKDVTNDENSNNKNWEKREKINKIETQKKETWKKKKNQESR